MEASRTNQAQNVSTAVGGEIYMLNEVETVEYVQKVYCSFAVRGVNMNVKVT